MTDNTIRQNIQNLLLNMGGSRKASFVKLAGEDIGKIYELSLEPMIIGRSPDCAVMVDEDQVSREHARVTLTESGYLIQDLQSTNGTLVNGRAIQEHVLQDGDRVQIGTATVLKFNYQDELESTFNEELYNSANRDYLTDVYNKKYLLDRLRMEFSFSKRHNTNLALIMFDLDHFKEINDKYGHLAGDEVLKGVCVRISQSKREEDVLARFGGEEFVVVLREADGKTAYLMAEKMRRMIADQPFRFEGKEMKITISLGVCALDDLKANPPASLDEFLLLTDNQLYRAKGEGRNRTCR
jgi:diguanylate cyclase (GGDEF)-like protein